MVETIVSIVAGAVLAIVTTISVERLRQPKLRLRILPPGESPYPPGRPAKHGRYLAIELVNEPLAVLFRWMSRNPALQCHGTITFHNVDGERFFAAAMPLRFVRSPQPIPMEIVLGEQHGVVIDPMRLSEDSRVDVFPGESTPIDVAVKFDSEEVCYGWSNLNYFSEPPWRHPDWKLPQGRFLICITVVSSGQKCARIFRLLNQGGPKDFRLEYALPGDKIIH